MPQERRKSITDTYSHLTRKIKSTVKRDGGIPPDGLTQEAVRPVLCGQTGFPDSADSLAYDPIQGLVAIGTPDGRIKVVGRPGVEATLVEAIKAPTKWMAYLAHRGGLLRATEDGDLQLFSIAEQRFVTSVWVEEPISDAVIIHGEQYLLVSTTEGNVKVVAITDADGEMGLGPAADLVIQPYQILGHELGGKGPIVAMSVTKNGGRPLVAIVFRNSGAVIWDVRAEQMIATASDEEDDPSKPTSVCWVGERANCFAVGYDDGSVLVWGIPPLAPDAPVAYCQEAMLVTSLRLVPDGITAAPVKSIKFISGNAGTPGGEDCLLVLGGQNNEDPDMLTLAPLESSLQSKPVPWFGAIQSVSLVPPVYGANASFEGHVRALLILTEGGRLVSYDLLDWQPAPLTVPVQELPPETAARFVPTLSNEQLDIVQESTTDLKTVVHALSLEKIRESSNKPGGAGQHQHQQRGRGRDPGPFGGGRKSALQGTGACGHPSGLLMTGHRDGRLRAWDATAEVPSLLATVPPSDPINQERFRAVTTFEVCPLSGIVAVGHVEGDVRLYQFSDLPQAVRLTSVDETLMPYDSLNHQPAGFQYVMKYSAHSADITAIAMATSLKLIAIADAEGYISVIDLAQPSQIFKVRAMDKAISSIALGGQMLPSPEGDVERIVLFVVGQDSSCCALSLQNGELIGKTLKPKNASKPICLALLDAGGMPILPMHGYITLPWADNNQLNVPAPRVSMPASEAKAVPVNPFGPVPEDSLEMHELPYDEVNNNNNNIYGSSPDTETKKKKKFGLFRRRSKSPKKDKRTPGKSGGELSPAISPGMSPHAASTPGADSHPTTPGQMSDFDAAMDAMRLSEPPGSPGLPVEESLIEYPYLELLGSEPSVAAYVLICTKDYLRLYSTESIYLGDRSTDRKTRHNVPVLSSNVFRSFNGPGIVSLTAHGSLLVHTIPNLVSVYAHGLDTPQGLGFEWSPCEKAAATLQQPSSVHKDGLSCVSACSLDGQLFLSGVGNEVIRIAVVADCIAPKAPFAIYDWDLSAAHLRNRKEEARASRTSDMDAGSVHSMRVGAAAGLPPRPLPSLNDLFEQPVEELDDVIYWDEDLDGPKAPGLGGSSSSRTERSPSPSVKSPGQLGAKIAGIIPLRKSTGKLSKDELSESQRREELLGRQTRENSEGHRRAELLGARRATVPSKAATGKPAPMVKRSKSEISRVYGHTRAQDAKTTMEQNRKMLDERGRKLKGIEEKGQELQDGAEDFASMAQELEQMMANKGKWWKF